MSITFKRFDATNYLRDEDSIAAYLDAAAEGAAEDGDPGLLVAALATVARARNLSQVARDAGITREGLYKALAVDGNPSFATVARIATALGLRLQVALPPKANTAEIADSVT
jgi:probable addiction module antidote protein